jgi:hypothetical protein
LHKGLGSIKGCNATSQNAQISCQGKKEESSQGANLLNTTKDVGE